MLIKPNNNVIFNIEDKPPLSISLLAGLQHTLVMIGNTIMVPTVLGTTLGLSPMELAQWLSYVMFTMGIATLFQINKYIGSKLPIIQGPSAAYIICIATLIPIIHPYAIKTEEIMQYLAGTMILCGIFEVLLGYTGIIGKLKNIITPVVACPVLMSIGFSLAKYAINNSSYHWPIALATFALIMYFSFVMKNKHIVNIFNAFSILASFTIMYLVCLILTDFDIFEPGHPAHIDLTNVINANWIRSFKTILLPYGIPKFNFIAFVVLLPGVFVSVIESLGDYHSFTHIYNNTLPTEITISKGIGSEGLGLIAGGLFGGLPSTSYSENIGAVKMTGIASRYIISISAFILILLSFIGKFSAILSTIPKCILGGAYIVLFATIGAAGLSMMEDIDVKNNRNLVIISVAFLASIGIPPYINGRRYLFNVGYSESITLLGEFIWDILKSPMAVSALIALLLDMIIPVSNDERISRIISENDEIIITADPLIAVPDSFTKE